MGAMSTARCCVAGGVLVILLLGLPHAAASGNGLAMSGNSMVDPLRQWLGEIVVHLPNQTIGGKTGSYTLGLYELSCSACPTILLAWSMVLS